MDYLRSIFLFRGKVIFVEDDDVQIQSKNQKYLLRTILLFCLTYFFRCSAFETWTLINSQVMFFHIPFQNINIMSQCINHILKVEEILERYPKAQCICGCTTLVLQQNYNQMINIQIQNCKCTKNDIKNSQYICPSDGCQEYLDMFQKRYKVQRDSIKWGYLKPEQFLIGPFNQGMITSDQEIQFILNSFGPNINCIPHPKSDNNLNDWTIFKCKICHMYMFALNNKNSTIALVMNNLIKRSRFGIMVPNALQNYKIKTPVLRNFNLHELK